MLAEEESPGEGARNLLPADGEGPEDAKLQGQEFGIVFFISGKP